MNTEFNVQVKLTLTYQRLEDTIVNALEGGSNYWYYLSDSAIKNIRKYVSKDEDAYLSTAILKAVARGAEVEINDYENESEVIGIFSKATIAERINKFAQEQSGHFMDIMNENDDATTADVLFQYLVLGEIVYG